MNSPIDINHYPTLYACPVCQLPLAVEGNSLQCANKHNFDRHKKGYINLLLAHQKNSKSPGDNHEMVLGRREFLRAGHYQAFASAIIELIQSTQSLSSRELSVLDAGCGEGFYTEQLQQALASEQIYGLDISKSAITAAATNKKVHWSVASSSRLPFIANSFDMVVSIFSRIEKEAFLQVLKPQGYILYAGPGDNHLHTLRSIIYDEVNEYTTDKHHDYFGEHFTLIKEQSLQVPIQLNDHHSIMQLLNMTPHAHRIPQTGRERLKHLTSLKDMGDFRLYLYQKI